jgi:hypothetical protein
VDSCDDLFVDLCGDILISLERIELNVYDEGGAENLLYA